MDLVHGDECEEDLRTNSCQRDVLSSGSINFAYDGFLLVHFELYGGGLRFELFKSGDDGLVLEDAAVHVIKGGEQLVLEFAQSDDVLALQFHELNALLFDFRCLMVQEDVQTLVLQRRWRDCEVDEGDT